MTITMTGRTEFAKMTINLRKLGPSVTRGLTKEFKTAAAPVVADAKRRASWSTRIPGAISVKANRSQANPGVVISVDTSRAPHARPYEFGHGGGTFKHPTYGHKPWVIQPTRPYLIPAIRAGRSGFQAAAKKAVEEAAAKHGLK